MIIKFSNGAAVDARAIAAMSPRKRSPFWPPGILVDLHPVGDIRESRRSFAVDIESEEEMLVELRKVVELWESAVNGS